MLQQFSRRGWESSQEWVTAVQAGDDTQVPYHRRWQYHGIIDSDQQVHARAIFPRDEEEFSFTKVEFEMMRSCPSRDLMVWTRSCSMWPEMCDLSGMMRTRLKHSQQCQVQRSVVRRIWWLTVSNAEDKSRRMRHWMTQSLWGVLSHWLKSKSKSCFVKDTVGGRMVVDCTFKCFREELKKRYKSIVSDVSWV